MEKETSQKEIIVPTGAAPQRLDAYLAGQFTRITRSQIQRLIEGNKVTLNGRIATKSSEKVNVHDAITMDIGLQSATASDTTGECQPTRPWLKPAPLTLDIVYEDEDLLVINKDVGVVVHPGAGTKGTTLVEGILYYLGQTDQGGFSEGAADPRRPGVVHRLDKDTSGLLVWAKNPFTHEQLAKQFAQKTNLRRYIAILNGTLQQSKSNANPHEPWDVTNYLGRDPFHRVRFKSISIADFRSLSVPKQAGWRYSKTRFNVVREFRSQSATMSLCKIELFTGRTHQIRIHARDLNAPVLGDALYGTPVPSSFAFLGKVPRQMLHAAVLGFVHPRTGEALAFESDIPPDMRAVLDGLHN